MKNFIVVSFVLFISLTLHGQINPIDSLENKYYNFHELSREDVYLHINKTTFLKGEDIWFTGYVQDRKTDLPSLKSTTLYVFLYDMKTTWQTVKFYMFQKVLQKGNLTYPTNLYRVHIL